MFGITPYNRRNNMIGRRNDFWDIGSMFENFFNETFLPGFFMGANPMRADIRETEKEYIIDAEIPGVKKEDIKLELRDDILTIAVEHNEELNEERENYIRKERRYGSFSRSFQVDNVRHEDVKARYENGILTVILPKKEGKKANSHRIEIQ